MHSADTETDKKRQLRQIKETVETVETQRQTWDRDREETERESRDTDGAEKEIVKRERRRQRQRQRQREGKQEHMFLEAAGVGRDSVGTKRRQTVQRQQGDKESRDRNVAETETERDKIDTGHRRLAAGDT